jgi:hypothetical protein
VPNPKWLILTALTLEARTIADACGEKLADPPEPTILRGQSTALLHIIGIAGRRIGANIFQSGADGVILAGLAGALDPSLQIADIIATPDPGPWPPLPWRRGSIYTSDKIIETFAAKAELFQKTSCLAVDMETDIVRRLAASAALPLLTIRSISDTAHDSVSAKLMNWIDDFGNPKPTALAAGLATNPLLVPQLMKLGQRSNQAAKSLGRAIQQLLNPAMTPANPS